jgi:hypothetical protein
MQQQRQLRIEKAVETHLLYRRTLPKFLNIRKIIPTGTSNANEKIVAEEYEHAISSVIINPSDEK